MGCFVSDVEQILGGSCFGLAEQSDFLVEHNTVTHHYHTTTVTHHCHTTTVTHHYSQPRGRITIHTTTGTYHWPSRVTSRYPCSAAFSTSFKIDVTSLDRSRPRVKGTMQYEHMLSQPRMIEMNTLGRSGCSRIGATSP